MSKVISIEVGYSITKICETDYKKKNPKVYKSMSIPTPEGIVEDGLIADSGELVSNVKSVLSAKGIKTKSVIFTVTSSKIVTREVTLPAVKKSQIAGMITANASEYFPIDLAEYKLAHLVMDTTKDENKKNRYKVLVMAIDHKIIQNYEKLAQRLGLRLQGIDYSGNSIYQMMRNECNEETEMIVKIEEMASVANVISGKSLVLQRSIVYGVDDAVQAFMESDSCRSKNYIDAIQQLRKDAYVKPNLKGTDADGLSLTKDKVMNTNTAVTNALLPLISNISRVVDLYNSKNAGKPIRQIRLVGLGSMLSGFAELLSNELGIRVISMKRVSTVHWGVYGDEEVPGNYVACIGASMNPVGYTAEQKMRSDAKNVNYATVSILMGVFFALIAVGLSVVALTRYNDLVEKEKELLALEAQYSPAKEVYNTYSSLMEFYKELEAGYYMTENPNNNLVSFLEELEIKLPADAVMTDFLSDQDKAVLSLVVRTKEEAAKVIQVIREFDSIQEVVVTGIEESGTSDEPNMEVPAVGEGDVFIDGGYKFNVECTYYPVSANTQETGTTPAE